MLLLCGGLQKTSGQRKSYGTQCNRPSKISLESRLLEQVPSEHPLQSRSETSQMATQALGYTWVPHGIFQHASPKRWENRLQNTGPSGRNPLPCVLPAAVVTPAPVQRRWHQHKLHGPAANGIWKIMCSHLRKATTLHISHLKETPSSNGFTAAVQHCNDECTESSTLIMSHASSVDAKAAISCIRGWRLMQATSSKKSEFPLSSCNMLLTSLLCTCQD